MVQLKETAEAVHTGVESNGTIQMEEEETCPQLVPALNTSEEYFSSYDDVEVHRLMVRDRARTEAYQRAILGNSSQFRDKVVMDIGAGTGILSLFAKQAGARKVFAVEASPLAETLKQIVELNDEKGVIEVIHGKAEEVELPGGIKVDIIISEWMGFYLLHESMLDSVISARDLHLAEDGVLLPSHATVLAAPVQLDSWVAEQFSAWSEVYGFDMTPMAARAVEARLRGGQPEIQQLEAGQLLGEPQPVTELDLRWVQREEVAKIEQRKFLSITKSGNFHGVALWFDVKFAPVNYGEEEEEAWQEVELCTGPAHPATHWKQTVLVLPGNLGSSPVEEDEIVGWDLSLTQSPAAPRQYALQLEQLDPATEEHPTPCHCNMAKCALIAALLKKEEEDMDELEEIT